MPDPANSNVLEQKVVVSRSPWPTLGPHAGTFLIMVLGATATKLNIVSVVAPIMAVVFVLMLADLVQNARRLARATAALRIEEGRLFLNDKLVLKLCDVAWGDSYKVQGEVVVRLGRRQRGRRPLTLVCGGVDDAAAILRATGTTLEQSLFVVKLGTLLPRSISIGADGVAVTRWGETRFFSYEKIVSAEAKQRTLSIMVRTEGIFHFHIPATHLASSMATRIQHGIDGWSTPSKLTYDLSKPEEMPAGEWTRHLRAAIREPGYRSSPLKEDDLRVAVCDHRLQPEARIHAGLALREVRDPHLNLLIHSALRTTANPKVRAALVQIVSNERLARPHSTDRLTLS